MPHTQLRLPVDFSLRKIILLFSMSCYCAAVAICGCRLLLSHRMTILHSAMRCIPNMVCAHVDQPTNERTTSYGAPHIIRWSAISGSRNNFLPCVISLSCAHEGLHNSYFMCVCVCVFLRWLGKSPPINQLVDDLVGLAAGCCCAFCVISLMTDA